MNINLQKWEKAALYSKPKSEQKSSQLTGQIGEARTVPSVFSHKTKELVFPSKSDTICVLKNYQGQ